MYDVFYLRLTRTVGRLGSHLYTDDRGVEIALTADVRLIPEAHVRVRKPRPPVPTEWGARVKLDGGPNGDDGGGAAVLVGVDAATGLPWMLRNGTRTEDKWIAQHIVADDDA